ncbi:MAG TPA: CcmD family protein [Vicinamibacterales bacterium]|nr:CcmD family protein [Vicinamibacterales bacterium]
MKRLMCVLATFAVIMLASGRLSAWQPPAAQDGFVPVEQLGNEERLPAAPLVAGAYGVAWGAILFYVWTIRRRLARIERELADVARRVPPGGR